MPTLTELAEEALINARRLDAYTASKGLLPVSLDNDNLALAELPPELETARRALANSSHAMKRLALGPVWSMMEIIFSFTDVLSLQAIYEYNLPSHVPLEGTTSYAEIAKASSLTESLCRRFLIHAMENGIFAEVAGEVKHTAISRMLATDRAAFETAGLVISEFTPASARVMESLRRYPNSGEPNETAYNVSNDTPLSIYAFLEQHPSRMSRFGAGMKFFSRDGGYDLKYLVEAYPWKSVDRSGTVVVDIGGGIGTVSRTLATVTKNIKFVIQDLPGPLKIGRDTLPEELNGRVEYEIGDFFSDQKIVGAEIYFFRWILHNWSDEYCIKILRSLVPAMKKQSKVLIYEYILAEGPEGKWTRKHGRNLDMVMLACFNASERTVSDLKSIFERADERFFLESTSQPEGSTMSLVTFGWNE